MTVGKGMLDEVRPVPSRLLFVSSSNGRHLEWNKDNDSRFITRYDKHKGVRTHGPVNGKRRPAVLGVQIARDD